MQQQFIPVRILIDEEVETLFINLNLVQSVIQKDDYIIIEMTNQQQYIIPDTNIQVFMDRFKQ
jgi:hypothetical protein|tara:strand:+ start:1973 stop:2161 length:189 start_codon:yes stop_codon:yes gene_type:complete